MSLDLNGMQIQIVDGKSLTDMDRIFQQMRVDRQYYNLKESFESSDLPDVIPFTLTTK